MKRRAFLAALAGMLIPRKGFPKVAAADARFIGGIRWTRDSVYPHFRFYNNTLINNTLITAGEAR